MGLIAGAVWVGVADEDVELPTVDDDEDTALVLDFVEEEEELGFDEPVLVVEVSLEEGEEEEVLAEEEEEVLVEEEEEDFDVDEEELSFEEELEVFELEDVFVDVERVEVTDLEVDVEVLVEDVEEGFTDPLVLLVDATLLTLLLVLASDESMYISSLFPAPQYSYGLPGQVKEQSERVVLTDPALGDVPQ